MPEEKEAFVNVILLCCNYYAAKTYIFHYITFIHRWQILFSSFGFPQFERKAGADQGFCAQPDSCHVMALLILMCVIVFAL